MVSLEASISIFEALFYTTNHPLLITMFYWLLWYFRVVGWIWLFILHFGHAYTCLHMLVIIKRTKNKNKTERIIHIDLKGRMLLLTTFTDTDSTLCALLLESWNRNFGGFQKKDLFIIWSHLSLSLCLSFFIVCSPPPPTTKPESPFSMVMACSSFKVTAVSIGGLLRTIYNSIRHKNKIYGISSWNWSHCHISFTSMASVAHGMTWRTKPCVSHFSFFFHSPHTNNFFSSFSVTLS